MPARIHGIPRITTAFPSFGQGCGFRCMPGSLQLVGPAVIGLGLEPCEVIDFEALPVGDLPEKPHCTRIIFAFDISHAEVLS